MEFLTEFFSNIGLATWFSKLSPSQGTIVIVLIILMFILSTQIKKIFNSWCTKMFKKRSCGDCVLILLGLTEKYRSQEDTINRNLLNKKMNYVEQKIEYIIVEILRNYRELQIKKNNTTNITSLLNKEYWGYKHNIINAFDLVKKECKRAFLENGFHLLTDKEFSFYVKEKVIGLISILQSYIMNDYPEDNLISLGESFDTLDKNWFEDLTFEIFMNAKQIQIESEEKIKQLEKELTREIDNFIKGKVK